MNNSSVKTKVTVAVLMAGLLPLLISLTAHFIIGDAKFVQEPLRAACELAGTFIALGVAMILFLRLRYEDTSPHLFWVVLSLVAMGLVDGVHAIYGISILSWQRHGATLIGGVIFGLVWLPVPPFIARRKGLFVFTVALLAIVLGIWLGSAGMPVIWDPVGLYIFPVKAANALGGFGFLVAALFFLRRYLRQPATEDLIFTSLAVLFGISSLLFGVAHTWAADWWVWHGTRLFAYIFLFIAAYNAIISLYQVISQYAQELDVRVRERTADLQSQIAERKLVEESLKSSEEKFRNVFDNSAIGKSITGIDGTVNVNLAFAGMLGHSLDEMAHQKWQDISHPDDYELTQKNLMELQSGEKKSVRFVKRYFKKDGSIIWGDVSMVLQRDKEDKPLYYITAVVDITERTRAEEALKQKTLDLEQSNTDLEHFAYVASHDLQEPLRMISSYTQLLERDFAGRLDAKARKHMDYVVDGAVRLQGLINDLLTYSRIGRQNLPLESVDSHTLLGEAIRDLSSAIVESKAIVINDELPVVRVIAVQLIQVFQNLIGNAIKFRREGVPQIHVSARDTGREWLFSIKDNGIGIDSQYGKKLFVLFQRLHTQKEYPGTGIGLALCRRIMERHGGKIWFESELGKGTTFYFTIQK